jgi:hypothetical protein
LGPFTAADAREAGIRPRRLLARDLRHPFHGVHLAVPATSVEDLCRAYAPVMPEDAWFSHQTAAALLGIPLPASSTTETLHVSVAFPRTPPSGRGVVGHSLGTIAGTSVEGMPVCSPAHVWCQLSGVLDREDLVAAGDHLVGARSRVPLAEIADLAALSEELRRTKGSKARTWALSRIRYGADSRPETLLRLLLESWGVSDLVVNSPLAVAGGRLTLHPDLLSPAHRLAFEYEGDGHRVDRHQWHRDIERRELLEAEGWHVLRITAADLFADRAPFRARVQRFVPNVR